MKAAKVTTPTIEFIKKIRGLKWQIHEVSISYAFNEIMQIKSVAGRIISQINGEEDRG